MRSTASPPPGSKISAQLRDAEYREITRLVYQHSRINLGENKRELVTSRLSKRLRSLNLPSFASYLSLIKGPKGATELSNFVDAISTNHTYFFREEDHFKLLREQILPQAGSTLNARPFRVWCAAASSGEEPYTLGITLEEHFSKGHGSWALSCTDISTRVLKTAGEAIYSEEKVRKVPQALMRKYFEKGMGKYAGQYRVKSLLRSRIRFIQLNLLGAAYPFQERFDTIFCRNVMIYFDKPTQQELVDRMVPLMQPGAYLLIGHAESLTGIRHPLKAICPAVYQKPVQT